MKNLIKAAIIIAFLSNTVSADTWMQRMDVKEGYAMAVQNAEVGKALIQFTCSVDAEGCGVNIYNGPECTEDEYYLADVTSDAGSISISLLCVTSNLRMWVSSGYSRIFMMMEDSSYISMKIHADDVQTLRFPMIGSSKALEKVYSRYSTIKEIDQNRGEMK